MYVAMRVAATALLSLTLVLLPDPGATQFGPGKLCQCALTVTNNTRFEMLFAKRVISHEMCPLQKLVQFLLNNTKTICAQGNLPKVEELVKCLRESRKCSDSSSSDSKQEFSKGSNVNPSTTSAKPPTTPLVTTTTTTQSEGQTSLLPTKEPTMPIKTLPPVHDTDTDQGGSSLHKGVKENSEPEQNEDPDGKMREMKIAIISLILIVLAMVAVGTGLYCRNKKKGHLQASCGSIAYTPAPSQESIPVVTIQ